MLNSLTRTIVIALKLFKKMQYVFGAVRCPEGKTVVIAVGQRAAPADGDQSGVALVFSR